MEIKKAYGKIILIVVFLLLCQALCAQEEEGYYVEYNDDKPKFIQRLVWEMEEYVLYYEVLIYVFDNGYREYSRNTTEDDLLLVSLPPGRYRYSVTPYDLLGIRCVSSEWKEFEVLPAFQPVLDSFTPEVFYLDRNSERVIQISGDNFLEDSEIYLQSDTDLIYPDRVVIDGGKSASLFFDDMKLIQGSFDIYILNPGGLSAQSGKFIVDYRKPLDFFLKLSWNPLIPVSGYMSEVMGQDACLAGASLSFEAVSSKRGNFNGGLGLAVSFAYFNPDMSLQTGNEDYQTGFLDAGIGFLLTSFDLNIVLQRRFNRDRMAFTFRFGFGVAALSYLENYEQDDIIIQVNLGVDYLVRLYRNLYLEAGLDLSSHVSPVSSGIIKPRLGLVLQF